MDRISKITAKEYFSTKSLPELGFLANETKKKLHPKNEPVTFVVDRNINYTNICSCKCKFCAFYKDKNEKEAYVLNYHQIKEKIDELTAQNGTQILLQGGLNKDLSFDYYLNLISNIKNDFPSLDIHAFSPPEIAFIAEQNNISEDQILKKLINAGLSSIPGGGAEILSDNVRSKISPNKINSKKWLSVMETAHSLGLKTTATMVFGFGESIDDILNHLEKIRKLQDKTKGFTAFIPWTFQPLNTEISTQINLKATAFDYLKTLAISRIFLDNISNIQASWVTQGLNVAQLSLSFGANDFGGTMMEENVVKSAGIENKTNAKEIIEIINNAGFIAAQRDTQYNILKKF